MFKALLLEKDDAGFRAGVREVDEAALPEGDVTVRVEYSTLNYKDALAITDKSPVVRSWPMVAGIDGAGTVLASSHSAWQAGDTGRPQRLGRRRDALGLPRRAGPPEGRLAGRAAPALTRARRWRSAPPATPRCSASWRSSGTASRPATARCSSRARAAASAASRSRCSRGSATGSRRPPGGRRRRLPGELGAAEIIDRAELERAGQAAAEGALGRGDRRRRQPHPGQRACQTRYGGTVAACGLAQGIDLPATVMPFILRGVTLAGIDSVMAPLALRQEAWDRLAGDLDPARSTSSPRRCRSMARSRRPASCWPAACGAGSSSGSERRARAQRISWDSRLNFGCWLVPSHSKMTISVVTTSAPSRRARSVAASRSCGWREPIASATHFTA